MVTSAHELFAVQVSGDGMHAAIECRRRGGYSSIAPGELVAVLEAANIEVSDEVTKRILEFTEHLKNDGPSGEAYEIAAGQAPEQGHDAHFEWHERYRTDLPRQWNVQGRPDFYDPGSFVEVEKGDVVGKLIRKVDGCDGCDVHGNSIPRNHIPTDLEPGEGLTIAQDGETLSALKSGKIEIKDGKISICTWQTIEDDVDLKTGKVKTKDSIHVLGSALNVQIESDASVTVDKSIEVASVTAGNDVVVGEGIVGRNRAKIIAGGCIIARFCETVSLKAGRDIRILTSATNANLHSLGKVDVAGGVIMGGSVYARDGVVAKAIGSDAGVKTALKVGIPEDSLALVAAKDLQIRAQEKAAIQLRQTVEPLMAQLKRLTPGQRERATELLYKADEIQTHIDEIKEQQRKILQQTTPELPAFVEVESRIYGGTTLQFDEYVCTLNDEIRGPVLVKLQEIKGQKSIVAINTFTHTQKILPSQKVKLVLKASN